MQKIYTSFEEIDNDLKILKVKKDIDLLCLKTDYQRILRNLSIKHLFSDFVSEMKDSFLSVKNNVFLVAGQYLLRKFFG